MWRDLAVVDLVWIALWLCYALLGLGSVWALLVWLWFGRGFDGLGLGLGFAGWACLGLVMECIAHLEVLEDINDDVHNVGQSSEISAMSRQLH